MARRPHRAGGPHLVGPGRDLQRQRRGQLDRRPGRRRRHLTFDGSLGAASNKSAVWDAAAPGGVSSITESGAYTGTVEVAANLSTMTLNQTVAAGLLTVDAGDTLSAYTYLLNASALYGPGSVYANSMTVAGGAYISGTNKVTVGGNLQVNGTVTLDNTATLINAGTISAWNGGQINVLAGSQIINSGTFTVQCDQTLHGVNGKFNNPGTFIKNGTPGTTDINITFNNQPLAGYPTVCKVTANSGKLEFDRPGSQAGEFDANGTAVIEFSASTQTLAPGTTFGGSGSVVVDGTATLSAGAGVLVNVGTTNFELGAGGTLGGLEYTRSSVSSNGTAETSPMRAVKDFRRLAHHRGHRFDHDRRGPYDPRSRRPGTAPPTSR